MVEKLRQKLSESKTARWTVLALVSLTMMFAYFISDIMSPLKTLLEAEIENGGLGWTSYDFGVFNSAYGWFTVFFFMLIFGGIILDKLGSRFTGVLSVAMMIGGVVMKYLVIEYAVHHPEFAASTIRLPFYGTIGQPLFYISLGYGIFCMGSEIAGITVTRIIARWFAGKELALAMGLQVACARLGTAAAFFICPRLPAMFDYQISAPVLLGAVLMCIGLVTFLVFCVMDKRLDSETRYQVKEDPFRMRDILSIVTNRGFWYLALLCLVFYSGVFPFLKNATDFFFNKYHISLETASLIPMMLPLGTILLTPIFGGIYDKRGRGATLMMIGAGLLFLVHVVFAVPAIDNVWVAAAMMIVLGIAFSLVPSAMWPSVTKVIPANQLGTAYALIFWLQNVGLMGVPLLINSVLSKYGIIGTQVLDNGAVVSKYDYTLPMIIFAAFSFTAIILAYLFKREDKRKGYGIEQKR